MTFLEPNTHRIEDSTTRVSNPRVAGSIPAAPTSLNPQSLPEQPSDLLRCELVDNPLVREQATEMLERLSWEPDERKRHAGYLRLAKLIRDIRGLERGFGYWPLAFASVLVIGASLWIHAHRPVLSVYSAPTDYWRVLREIDSLAFVMQNIHEGHALPPTTIHFCAGLEPQFEIGETLVYFAFVQRGPCADLGPEGAWYTIDRGPDGWVKLARNCRQDPRDPEHGRVSCEGVPEF